MRENALLADIAAQFGRSSGGPRDFPLPPGVVVGPGDDCAVVASSGGAVLLTTDQLIEGRHFVLAGRTGITAETLGLLSLEEAARKAVARSVSDIAAMGGTPRWSLGTGALPQGTTDADARTLTRALHRWADHWGCPMVGGDVATTFGPMVLTVTVGGVPHPRRGPVLRSGARPGDVLCVTGRLGGSLPSRRHALFTPRVDEAFALCTLLGPALHAMMDLSDGLGLDAARMARASDVRIEIDGPRVPLSDACTLEQALADGEDYELLVAIDPAHPIPPLCPGTRTPLTIIGRVLPAGAGGVPLCTVLTAQGPIDASTMGFEHGGL